MDSTEGTGWARFTVILPERFRRWMYDVGGAKGLNAVINQVAQTVGKALAEDDYVGTAGIDMMVHMTHSEFVFRPIVEVNPRHTMGQLAIEGQRICRSSDSLFLIVKRQDAETLEQAFPPTGAGGLENGILRLTCGTGSHCAILAAGEAALHLLHREALDVQIKLAAQNPSASSIS